ncbi:MAG: DUF1553 domain-containing protein [Akkermansiaceae bacterium]|nr:DUF1553 domain-containing protein [Akkermansiaceae bacterium]MDP4646308.1 DUF1553 domain-containing protein [Akkermansiaceae bacterium]MDP4721458.1 DUF1553 domain-containing protein [Akkermansiaceae bacterium]MDP4779851.1 DUF1553 domain-containing protein [Akkermansiaceae bacterium]MDP4896309.1 DUF1553 domain-containing protein [Akkermansiaceae bacterium]
MKPSYFVYSSILLAMLAAGVLSDAVGKGAGEAVSKKQGAVELPDEVTFNEHIQPILSEYCYHCHGPDSSTRMPEKEPLRLDLEEEAFKMRDFGAPVIVKGKPEESEIIYLMRSDDKSEVMPPPESHKVMNEREIALVEKWISQGAVYEDHWSYEPVVKPEAPKSEWSANPIDGFVLEKLKEEGFEPNPEEDARRLHRRMSLDLTGLPPEPGETDAFVVGYEKDADAAVSAEADRMLGTIQSAEQFARHWLDVARYADTHGIHIDNYRSIWPYRDWVVRAFHSNMKWDQFTTEQLAGDLLENATLDQHVATGFLRSSPTTGEGGAIAEEYEAIYAADRVDTMGAAWLGLTASCASCHDHKFDPFSTKEFYQLTAFFRNNTMTALDGNQVDHPPAVFVPQLDDREEWSLLDQQMQSVDLRIASRTKEARGDFNEWLSGSGVEKSEVADSTLSIHLPLAESVGNIRGTVDGEPREWPIEPERVDGLFGKAVVISNGDIELGDIGNFSRGDQVSYGGFIWIEGSPSGAVVAKMNVDEGHRGWDLWLQDGKVGAHVIDSWDKSATKVIGNPVLKPKQWHHVMITFDGTKSSHQVLSVFIDGRKVGAPAAPNSVGAMIETTIPLRLGSRDNGATKLDSKVVLQDFRFYRRLLAPVEINRLASVPMIEASFALPAAKRTPAQNKALFDYFITRVDPPSLELLRERQSILGKQAPFLGKGAKSLVFEEKKNSEPFAHILVRGAYASKGEKVFPDTPAMLPPMDKDAPKDRLGLATWLNDPANPLPARVTMNRLWSYFFGTGIVESAGDFGIMGARPTHPKLLDWLAAEFVESEWDFRHMVKTIVTSKAYRQSGVVSPEKLEKDPTNTLISRGPRTRLDAEQIRDLALASAEILSEKVGGPSVKPYQPEGIWEAVAMPQSNTKDYRRDTGDALYRRSFYSLWKRTAPPAAMVVFDAPSRERFCVGRDVTNTPLQALALMNDEQIVEAARLLATKTLKAASGFDERIDLITVRVLSRKLEMPEREAVKETLDTAIEYYSAKPSEAVTALLVGESKPDESLPAPELAAWTLVATQIFNLDETITK